jgi:hypothetical protein
MPNSCGATLRAFYTTPSFKMRKKTARGEAFSTGAGSKIKTLQLLPGGASSPNFLSAMLWRQLKRPSPCGSGSQCGSSASTVQKLRMNNAPASKYVSIETLCVSTV